MEFRRWSATVSGAPPRRHHEPGYLEVRRVPTVETQGPGLGVAPLVRSFPGRGPGSENRAHPPPHPDGCLRCRPGDAGQRRHHDLVRGARRRRIGAAPDPAVRCRAVGGHVGRRPTGRRRQHRRVLLEHGQRDPGPRGGPRRHGGGSGRVDLRGGERQLLHHRRRGRRSGPAGQPDLRRARHGRRPDQLRRDEPRDAAVGHRADLGARRRSVRDGDSVGRRVRRHLRPGPRLGRAQGGGGDGRRGGDRLADQPAVFQRRLGVPEPGRRDVCRGPFELPGRRRPDDLARHPGSRSPGRVDVRHRSERAVLLHRRAGPRRRLELLPQLRGPAPADRLAVHRVGGPGHPGDGPVPDQPHLHQLGPFSGRARCCPSW